MMLPGGGDEALSVSRLAAREPTRICSVLRGAALCRWSNRASGHYEPSHSPSGAHGAASQDPRRPRP